MPFFEEILIRLIVNIKKYVKTKKRMYDQCNLFLSAIGVENKLV